MLLGSSTTEGNKDLPLFHPYLIDWGQKEKPQLDWIQNDEAIAEFLGRRGRLPYDDHKDVFAIDLDKTAYFRQASSSPNQDNDNKLEHISHNRMDALLIDKEQSTLLVEETEEINIGDAEKVLNIHIAKSLNPIVKEKFIQFFKQRPINFAWYYANMLRLDLELVLHHGHCWDMCRA